MMALFGLIACGAVFTFCCGVFVGMSYERALRIAVPPSRDARRLGHLRYAVQRYLDAEYALCRMPPDSERRPGSAEQMEFRAARIAIAEIVDWERPAPASSGVVRAAHAEELAS